MLNIIKFAIASLIALCVSFAPASGKGIQTDIKGKVLEKTTGAPLPYATVTVLGPDNKVVTGAMSGDKGEFAFRSLVDGDYKLQISFIGYKNVELQLKAGEKNIDLGNIELEADATQLEAAVVTAKVPLIEQKLDKVVMNVSESVMAKTSNGFEILRKAPGISVDPDGNILLNGQAVEVWIDNRPSRLNGSQLETLLSALDGNTIEKIEIMQHPSAKFDATGSGGIINIKTKKNFIKGFYGNVSLNYQARPYSEFQQGANGSINLNYRSKHANTYFTYTPRYSNNHQGITTTNLFGEDYEKKQISNSKFGGDEVSHYAKLGSDFYLNDKNTVGFLAGTNTSRFEMNSLSSNIETYTHDQLTEKAVSTILQYNDMNTLDANLYYTHTFNPASDLTINADYNYFDIRNGSFQRNLYYNPNEFLYGHAFNNDVKQYINIYSLKADYKNVFLKKGMIEAGAKWTRTNTQNNMVRTDSLGDAGYEYNQALSSHFIYREDVSAAYLSVSYQFSPKWSTMAGLRGEYTNTRGDWKSADTVTTQSYFDLFPTLFVGYTPSENWRLSFSYTMRVNRPRFSQLNPFRIYVDANSYIVGNPSLKPQYTHQISLNAGYKRYLNFGFMYQRSGNFISQDPAFDNQTGTKEILWSNFGTFTLIGGSVSLSELPLVDKVLFLSLNGFASNATSKSTVRNYKESMFFGNLYGGLTTVLPKGFKLELTGNYQSGLPFGYMNISSQYRINLGVKKSVWNDKGTFSLGIDDIFDTGNTNVEMYEQGLLIYDIKQQHFNRRIKFGFNYKFGNMQGKRRTNQRDDTSTRVGGGSGAGL